MRGRMAHGRAESPRGINQNVWNTHHYRERTKEKQTLSSSSSKIVYATSTNRSYTEEGENTKEKRAKTQLNRNK